MELLGAGSVLQLLLYMSNHKEFSQGTKRSIAALSETVYSLCIFKTEKIIDNARAISILSSIITRSILFLFCV